MDTKTIPGLSGSVSVTPWSIRANADSHPDPLDFYGTSGTLYHGDPDLLADFLADPQGELDIYGCIHHIHMTYARDVFTLRITFATDETTVRFGHSQAREIIFALSGVETCSPNPKRPASSD